ncbi:hypothetical protein [Photobacterium sp. 1_MG-2023]|uniref:hypothetical protein n=1 Tax=Photobacterium sp. 1_MG-2023 TaxID=3062646 RepID=UPI0026E225BA|nr:hypothetical protein [Photobacterium sp. 1_MG-2023]MDO6708955.1 hypothetical protein [Photobacterium sp. 1_MG-2023]
MRKWFVLTWALVATGLLLNILSALMTNFYIEGTTVEANRLVQQQHGNDKLISLTWQQIESLEQKKELVLILVSMSETSPASLPVSVAQELQRQLEHWQVSISAALSAESVQHTMTAVNAEQALLRDKINQLFIENLALNSEYTQRMTTISGLRSLALFLQIIGLALILARDLSRRQDRKA